ncbi:magnesium ion transporter [Lambiella insularis]|nr:magnesium ion transporter [Lambiella insularis]
MRSLHGSRISAPSSSLLQFLKSQTERICFFTPTTPQRSSAVCLQRTKRTVEQLGVSITKDRRYLSTSARRLATVESSLFNFVPDGIKPDLSRVAALALIARPRTKFQHHHQESKNTQRFSSSDTSPLFRKLWTAKRQKSEKTSNSGKLSSLPRYLGDGGGPALGFSAGKASNELKLRCTELDENGNVTLVNGEFKKSELIAKYGLLPRDLRKIDSSLVPHILIRPSAILINLLHIRVLIKSNRVLVFDAYGSTDSYTQSVFIYDLEGRLRQKQTSLQAGGLPYEFRALEAVLISVTSALETEFEGVREPVVRVLRQLEEDIDRDKLRYLLIYSKKLGTFEQQARLVRDSIDELLDQDDDLAAMYLTERGQGKTRDVEDHTDVEMLLESYHKVCDEIVQASSNLISNIRNTEEIVKAILDANRNSLMLLDLKFSIGTLGIGGGAFIAALYGMNLKNFMEESDYGFYAVSGFSFVFAAVVCSYGLTKLRKLQRVSMWGEQGRKNRGSWRDVDPMPALPGETRMEKLRRLKEAKHYATSNANNGLDLEGLDIGVPALREKR